MGTINTILNTLGLGTVQTGVAIAVSGLGTILGGVAVAVAGLGAALLPTLVSLFSANL